MAKGGFVAKLERILEMLTTLLKGNLAGLAATVPMTAVMAGMHSLLPPEERYPLPPRVITENLLEKADAHDELPESHETRLTLLNHFAYGAAMGAVYAAGLRAAGSQPTAANGVVFGLGVWAASYQAILPMAGLFPPAETEPPRRNALMIGAHIVWGAALGLLLKSANGVSDNGREIYDRYESND